MSNIYIYPSPEEDDDADYNDDNNDDDADNHGVQMGLDK